jgi:hypothetical protein
MKNLIVLTHLAHRFSQRQTAVGAEARNAVLVEAGKLQNVVAEIDRSLKSRSKT